METIAERIKRLREAKGWSRPELGRQMAIAIGREKPYSGELVRLYEEGENLPRNEARKALAGAFKLSEAYIEFGRQDVAQQPAAEYRSVSQRALDVARRFDQLSPACQEHVSNQIDLLKVALGNGDRQRAADHDVVIKGGAVETSATKKRRRS